jgi:hypothetical protein
MFGSSDEMSWKTSVTGMYGLTHVNHLSICSACVFLLLAFAPSSSTALLTVVALSWPGFPGFSSGSAHR